MPLAHAIAAAPGIGDIALTPGTRLRDCQMAVTLSR